MEFSQRIGRAQAGDRDVLEGLLAEWRPWLRQQAERLALEAKAVRFDGSDVVQMTLVDAYRKLDRFRGDSPGEFGNWLFRILKRQAAQQFRFHSRARRRADLDHHGSCGIGDLSCAPQQQALTGERRRQLDVALQRLPAPLREVVVGRVFCDLSFNTLAERLNRSPRVVRRQWTEALRRLADSMRGLTSSSASCAV